MNSYEGKDIKETIISINMIRTLVLAAGKFIPRMELKGELILFNCKNGVFDSRSKWGKYSKKITNIELEGDHFSIIKEPIVKDMASKIDEIISTK